MFKKRTRIALSVACCVCGVLFNACGVGHNVDGATYFIKTTVEGSDAHAHAMGRIYVDGRKVAEAGFTDEWTHAINGTSMEREYPVVTVEVAAEDSRSAVFCGISVSSPDRYPVKNEGARSVSCVFDSSRFSSYDE